MFYNYEIRNNGVEDILYLYLTMKYEFSKELLLGDKDIGRRCKNFINDNNIKFKGNRVFLIVDGIVVKTVDLSRIKNTYSNNTSFSVDNYIVNLRLDDNSLCEVSLREYLLGLLLYKYIDDLDDEVLKAICVLYNTYAYKMMKENNFISINNSFANYRPSNYYKVNFSNYNSIIKRLNSIINDVECIFLSYNNNYILPFMHYSNSGKTKKNSNYKYLSSVKSLWDITSPYYVEYNDYSFDDINKKLKISINSNSKIEVYEGVEYKNIVFDEEVYSIEEFKDIFNLKSSEIYIIVYNSFLRIITSGWGNSLGLSIYGANEIAKDGGKYYNILKYYFPKVDIYRYIKELSK